MYEFHRDVPTVEAFSGEHAKHDDEAGNDPDETDQRVNDCIYSQYHCDPPLLGALQICERDRY